MGHQAGKEFFQQKRPWSVRKDQILSNYLCAYLPKIRTQGRRILIVDGFAGAGRFEDGSSGSPLLIAQAICRSGINAELLAIESHPALQARLESVLEPYEFAEVKRAEFDSCIPMIRSAAQTHSVFLFLDPFALKGLRFDRLAGVFELVRKRRSVEVLFNFNVTAFARCARAAYSTWLRACLGEEDDHLWRGVTPEDLTAFVGGDWWRRITPIDDFAVEIDEYIKGYCSRLREYFAEVCYHEIRAKAEHASPKYVLLFGSRHPDALLLMNDEMVKSRNQLAEEARPTEGMLFETRSLLLVPEPAELDEAVRSSLGEPMRRRALVLAVVRDRFGRFTTSDIRRCVTTMLKRGELVSSTGKTRINDDVVIRRAV